MGNKRGGGGLLNLYGLLNLSVKQFLQQEHISSSFPNSATNREPSIQTHEPTEASFTQSTTNS